jgi:hypothetical protein
VQLLKELKIPCFREAEGERNEIRLEEQLFKPDIFL